MLCRNPEFDPYLKAIGQLAVVWAEFEFSIDEAIWELANVERFAGTCITSQMIGPGARFRCLVALLKLRKVPEPLVKEVNVFSKEAEGLGRQRNRFVHDMLMYDVRTNTVRRMEATADRVMRHEVLPVEVAHIEELSVKISKSIAEFDGLHLRILDETPSWPRTQFESSQGIHRQRKSPPNSQTKL